MLYSTTEFEIDFHCSASYELDIWRLSDRVIIRLLTQQGKWNVHKNGHTSVRYSFLILLTNQNLEMLCVCLNLIKWILLLDVNDSIKCVVRCILDNSWTQPWTETIHRFTTCKIGNRRHSKSQCSHYPNINNLQTFIDAAQMARDR